MLPMLEIKRKMNIIKQPDKRDNAHDRSLDILEFSKKQIKINDIKSVFDVNLHHGLIRL